MATKFTYALALAIAAVLASHEAKAVPVAANGSFTLVPAVAGGSTTVNTGNITSSTSSKHNPDLVVQAVTPNLTLAIHPGDVAVQSSHTWPVPDGIGVPQAVDFSLTVEGIEFSFNTGVTNDRVALNLLTSQAGSFAEQFLGILADGNGVFLDNAPVTLSETCTQAALGGQAGLISCTNSVVTIGENQVPEPASLALLGSALLGLGLIRRRRT